MKKYICPSCWDEREVDDNVIMAVCSCCQCEMNRREE